MSRLSFPGIGKCYEKTIEMTFHDNLVTDMDRADLLVVIGHMQIRLDNLESEKENAEYLRRTSG